MADDVELFYETHNALTARLGGLPIPRSLTSHWLLFTGDLDRVWVAGEASTASAGGRVVCASRRWITSYTYTLRAANSEDGADADVLVVSRPTANVSRVDGGSAGASVSVALYFRDGSDPLLVPMSRGDSIAKLFEQLDLLNPVAAVSSDD
jgi:hypothetical protein